MSSDFNSADELSNSQRKKLAAAAFNASGGDLNTPEAALVLAGRGRPSNAGRYTGAVHTFMLGLRWSERTIGFE